MDGKEMVLNQWSFEDRYGWALLAVLAAAVLSLAVSLQVGVLTLVFAVLAWWVWQYPEEGFLLLLISMPILPMLKITQSLGTLTLAKDVIILTLFARQVGWPLVTKRLPYRRNILLAPLIALAAWSVVALVQADSVILGVLRLRDIGLYMVLYMAVLYLDHSLPILKRRAQWLVASAGVMLALGGWQWFWAQDSAVLRFDPAREVWIPRLSSALAHPSVFGHYLLWLTAGVIGWGVVASKRWKLVAGGAATVLAMFVFLTYSRAVWIGFMAVLAAVGLAWLWREAHIRMSKKQVSSWLVGAGLVAGVGLLLAVLFTPAGPLLRSIVDPTYGSNEERLEFFVRLVAPVSTGEAIVGAGLGDVLAQNFREVDLETADIAAGDARAVQLTKNRTLVDNQYLKTFIEMGVVGLALYGWLCWRLAAGALRLTRKGEKYKRVIGLWQIGFLAAFLVQALFIDVWDIFPTNLIFWGLAAVTSAVEV